MYSCRVCDKTYRLRSSLTRHLRNHSLGSSQHVCPTCDVAFSRRDLLRRHSQIHDASGNQQSSSIAGNEPARSAARQRCHTACQPCREARVKCNAEYPCAQCISSNRECRFSAKTNRVSRTVEVNNAPEPCVSPGNGALGDGIGLYDASPETQRATIVSAAPNMLQSPVSNIRSPIMQSISQDDCLSTVDHMAMTEVDISWANSLPCATGSWPWLHEDLFLQGDAMLNCTEETDTSYFTQFDLIHDYPGLNAPIDGAASQQVPNVHSATSKQAGFDNPAATNPQMRGGLPTEQQERIEAQRPRPPDCSDHRSVTVLEEKLVDELVAYPGNQANTKGSTLAQSLYWQHMSIRIAEAFRLDRCPSEDSKSLLFRMMDLYRTNFSPLWPMINGNDFNHNKLHPLLFLTVVSIGCMYGNTQECKLGNMLHECIRKHLTEPFIGLENSENDILWLAQARLLTQVAALYFGQRRGFTYAQHLGAILIVQARRMDLFSSTGYEKAGNLFTEQEIAGWANNESRKRLAFGILRADIFASVLLNTRPLLSAEEIHLDLPTNDEVWENMDKIPQDQLVALLRAELSSTLGLPFCDLVRVAEDRGEALLNMNARGYELLLFGLQGRVWQFSHDRSMFTRLTGHPEGMARQTDSASSSITGRISASSSSNSDKLGIIFRGMEDLRDDCHRTTQALQKWEQSFTAIRTTQGFGKDRTSVMSSMLLLHISYLRLCAPLADIHSAAYTIMENKHFEQAKLRVLFEWTKSSEAMRAVGHVRQIWSLLHHEISRRGTNKAKYNLLAFSGLHHAAVIIWVFAGSHKEQNADAPELPGWDESSPISLVRDNSQTLLRTVVSLYKRLIPRGWISFAAAAEKLALHPFPECS